MQAIFQNFSQLLIAILLSSFSLIQAQDAVLLTQKTDIYVIRKTLIKKHKYQIQINNRQGEKFARISIPYSDQHAISNLTARICNNAGQTIRKLKSKEVNKRSMISDYSFYEDIYVKEFTLRHSTYPYIIEYSWEETSQEFIYIDIWSPILGKDIPCLDAQLTVSVPTKYKIYHKETAVEAPEIDTLTGQIRYIWNIAYTDLVKDEACAPHPSSWLPTVRVIPEDFRYEIDGSQQSWKSLGNWQYEINKDLNDLPDYEKRKIDELTRDLKDKKEKIRVLYHYLQDQTHYINISTETGGLVPYPASYVAEKKYGDCKALTNYFKAVLEYAGIPSYYTKVFAGDSRKEIDLLFPSPQFNHIILFIPGSEDTIWLDCTSDAAFNYLGTFTQNRKALIIAKDSSYFQQTPALAPKDVEDSRHIFIKHSITGAYLKFHITYRGDMYETIKNLKKSYNKADIDRIFRKYLLNGDQELLSFEIIEVDRDSCYINLECEAQSNNIYKIYGNDIILSNIPFYLPEFEKPSGRKLPLQIDYPIYETDSLIYDIPSGYDLNSELPEIHFSNEFGSYKAKAIEKNQQIHIIKSFLINSGDYPISKYKDFYDFIHKIRESESQLVILLKK